MILAGVSISLILDNNGIIQKSKEARREYGQARENEQEQIEDAGDWIEEQVTGKVTLARVPVDTKANKNGTINGEEGNSNNPTIPKGYTPIDTETSAWGDGSSTPAQDSVDHGLVIKDDSNNEWVWIPVPDVTIMCDTSNTTECEILYGPSQKVKTKLYTKSMTIGKEGDTVTISRTKPGITSSSPYYREPDLVYNRFKNVWDRDEENYKNTLGFESEEEMAEKFMTDYSEMIASIDRYGGFYIGRYELSEAGVQKDKATLTNTNWYNLYKKCKELNASNKVETRMIWGGQWDVTCDFIANKGDEKNIIDSRSWGNHSDSIEPANTGNYEQGVKKNTGSNENWKANNIYDIAGNCSEWTQEMSFNSTLGRANRGGDYIRYGAKWPASFRYDYKPEYQDFDFLRYSSNFNNKVTYKS